MPVTPGCCRCSITCWNLTSVIIPLNSVWTFASVCGRPRSLLRLLMQSSWRSTRANQRGEWGKKWMQSPRRVALTICRPKGRRNDISLSINLVPNVIQYAMTAPETTQMDSSTRRVPRRFGGEISEIYSGAPLNDHICQQAVSVGCIVI